MKISDIRQGSTHIVELSCKNNEKIKVNSPVKIVQNGRDILLIPMDKQAAPVTVNPTSGKYKDIIDSICKRNLPRLSYIVSAAGEVLTVEIKIFPDEKPMDISIGIEDDFVDKVKKKTKLEDIRNPDKGLMNMYIVSIVETNYAVMGINIKSKKKEQLDSFILAGREGYIQIKKKEDEEGNIFFIAEKILPRVEQQDYAFYLIKGKISFKNETALEKARLQTLACISEIGDVVDSYMNTWQKYGELEQEQVLDNAKEAGVVKFYNSEYLPDGSIRLDIEVDENLNKLMNNTDKGTGLLITSSNPKQYFNDELSIEGYYEFLDKSQEKVLVELTEKITSEAARISVRKSSEEAEIPNSGYLSLSLMGDINVFKRRSEAREKILNASSYMPHLAAILEGKTISKPVRNRIEPISDIVKNEIFPIHDPTPMQKEAIDVALNTPDVALIQGPPGTGKTTVILAILKRLNEISDATGGIFGRNLVSAFQHDAVKNAVERIEVLGLPAIKLGKKRGEAEDTEIIERTVENWISGKLEELYKKYPNVEKEKYLSQFQDIYKNYLYSSNTVENTIKLLEDTKELLSFVLDTETIKKINSTIFELKASLIDKKDPAREYLIKCVYRIPHSKISYEDNGRDAIREAVFRLKGETQQNFEGEIKFLQGFLKENRETEEDFQRLRDARQNLLIKLLPEENIYNNTKQKDNVLKLFEEISDSLVTEFRKSKSGEDQVILDYINEYENNPLAVRNSILDYISVLGATNQQSRGKAITDLKGDSLSYDNVLIDEAARSNPLDLFIPMALAKERIILVGDHRQLPHIVDDAIVNKIEKNSNTAENESVKKKIDENIKKSMFEHLFSKLKQLEKKDGIKRTVTLDKQYRTHPVIGDFISKNFYERHGEVYIESGLKAEHFQHNLPGLSNKACVWYEVTNKQGKEIDGESKSRPVEANKLAEHLKQLIDSEDGKGLNFGVITFYAEQVKEIYKELKNVGIATKTEDGHYDLVTKYKEEEVNGKKIEKLRIGTVDAFQGMEFDVVYLSMVRSNKLPCSTEKEKRSKFGFLMVENRLCVSMSRQKKMLIVVGDSDMLKQPGAEEAIEPLVNFYNLCKGDEVYGKVI